MPPGIGYSFQPGSQDTPLQPRGQSGQGSAPQQAIRTLSLRVPQTQSVPGIAPLPLLNASGGGGSDLDMLLMALLKAFGGGGMAPQGARAGGGSTPPRIRPIEDAPLDLARAPAAPPAPGDRGGMDDFLANPPAPTGTPQIPRDFPPFDGPYDTTQLPKPEIPNDFPRGPRGGGFGGRFRGGVEPLF